MQTLTDRRGIPLKYARSLKTRQREAYSETRRAESSRKPNGHHHLITYSPPQSGLANGLTSGALRTDSKIALTHKPGLAETIVECRETG